MKGEYRWKQSPRRKPEVEDGTRCGAGHHYHWIVSKVSYPTPTAEVDGLSTREKRDAKHRFFRSRE